MIRFTAVLQRFEEKAEKSGWTYIQIPQDVTERLNPGVRKSFRIKGKIDEYPLTQTALIPMGEGTFILPTNAEMRRGIRKQEGAAAILELELDTSPVGLSEDLMNCLADDPHALDFFNTLPRGHQNYFSNWIESAKTSETKVKRISQAVQGLAMRMGYGEMIRYFRKH
jgi:hypothetical protein